MSIFINEITASDAGSDSIRSHLFEIKKPFLLLTTFLHLGGYSTTNTKTRAL